MTLKITRATDPIRVDRLNVCIYGQPGAGKSSLAFTASRPLMLDFDNGAHRAAGRKDTVQVKAWGDVASISQDDVAEFDTIILDTAGRALDCLATDIIRRDPKAGRGGALTLQGYGKLKAEFVAFLKLLNGFGKDVLLIAHMDEQRNGDDIIERLDVQGGSKGEIYKAADAMGRVFVKGGIRQLDFSPREGSFGKNPGQLDVLDIPHPDHAPAFLAGVIQSIKDKLNALTVAQVEAEAKLSKLREALADVEDADGVNALLATATEAGQTGKALLHARATALGLFPDKNAGQYAAAKEAA
ncbi:MAG: ATP-binding protein [Pseudomonadota bacterium]|nr:ATP-binding protein [Pseudomonadota bacterium]MDQ3160262.1 ATP-binding protein [Pseudomonadota bacterium]